MPKNAPHRPSAFRPLIAGILCCLVPGQTSVVLAAQASTDSTTRNPVRRAPAADGQIKELDSRQRILHVLSRFTFGPTQQDLAAFSATTSSGASSANSQNQRQTDCEIDQWFERQLHPDRIPDTDLETRLAEYPALQLPVDELLARFPSNAEIRQTANGKLTVPQDPYLAAIYLRHVHLYEDKQARKASAQSQQPGAVQSMQTEASMTTPTGASTTAGVTAPGAMPGLNTAAMSGERSSDVITRSAMSTNPSLPGKKMPQAQAARPSYADLLVKSVLALPPDKRIDRIVDMLPSEYDLFRANLKGPQRAALLEGMDAGQREYLHDYGNPTRTVVEEMQAQRLLRDIYSSRQLQEVMTTFWLNHFNVYLHKNDEEPYYLVSYERDVIRPRALGNFEDLLVATAESPAMLLYLDNSSSTGPNSTAAEKQKERAAKGKPAKATPPGLNENYARELMELHTLGVNGGYSQKDVTEMAKVFTGWTVDKPQSGGGFRFDETRHEPGKKLVLGRKIKEDGQKEGLQMLHILATSPATAHFISKELAINFVSDNPSPALVNRMARTFLDKHGDIPSILKTMLHSPEFQSSESYHAKVKTPLEYVVSAARASGTQIDNPQPLVNALNQMGMPLYACVPPTGYSAKADEWVSTGALVTRMNFGLSLATNHFSEIHTKWERSSDAQRNDPGALPQMSTPADAELVLEARLIPSGISEQTRSAVLSQSADAAQQEKQTPRKSRPTVTASPSTDVQKAADAHAAVVEKQDAQLAGLLLGSPEFQRR